MKAFLLFAGACGLFVLLAWVRTVKEVVVITNTGENQLTQNPSGHIFENIVWGDTLTLVADYDECGEFGGHRETVQVYRDGSRDDADTAPIQQPEQLLAVWRIDTARCPNRTRKFYVAGKRLISIGDEKIIANYLQELLARSWQQGFPGSNAGHGFGAVTSMSNSGIGFKDTEYNAQKQWKGFEKLRDRLFK